jgi:hypothetical protein
MKFFRSFVLSAEKGTEHEFEDDYDFEREIETGERMTIADCRSAKFYMPGNAFVSRREGGTQARSSRG